MNPRPSLMNMQFSLVHLSLAIIIPCFLSHVQIFFTHNSGSKVLGLHSIEKMLYAPNKKKTNILFRKKLKE